MTGELQIRRFAQGPFQTNGFLVDFQGDCFVVDAPEAMDEIIQTIQREGLKPRFLFITHAHGDHIEGIPSWQQAFPEVDIWIHMAEEGFLGDPRLNLSQYLDQPFSLEGSWKTFESGQVFPLKDQRWQVIHTPGHSPGSSCLHLEPLDILFAGDLLFRGSVGRSDFPTSVPTDLNRSLQEILKLDEKTQVHCGHGGSTTLAREKGTNPYLDF